MDALSHTHIALLGYVALILALLLTLATLRTMVTLSGRIKANAFLTTGEDVSPFSRRLVRAHANIYEFFPIYGGLTLYAIATNQTDISNHLALIFLGARFAQTGIHIISTSVMAVQARFFFFLVQLFIAAYWIFKFAGAMG